MKEESKRASRKKAESPTSVKLKILYFIAYLAIKVSKVYQVNVMIRQHGQVVTKIQLQSEGP